MSQNKDMQDELLALLAEHGPQTAHDLAKLAGRDVRSVATKLTWMRGEGVVESSYGPGTTKPHLWEKVA